MCASSGIQFLCVIESRQLGWVVEGQDVRERGERDIIHLLFTPEMYLGICWTLTGGCSGLLEHFQLARDIPPFTLHTSILSQSMADLL